MPTSLLALAPDIVHLAETSPGRRILDIGPGYGKYGLLLREYLNRKPERLVAVEKHRPYLEEWGWRLACIYDEVLLADGLELPGPDALEVERVTGGSAGAGDFEPAALPSGWLEGFDLVLLLDVIEHLPKDQAVELLARIPGRVIVNTPVEFFRSVPGHPTEEHVSHWTLGDFDGAGGHAIEVNGSKLGGIVVRLGPRS